VNKAHRCHGSGTEVIRGNSEGQRSAAVPELSRELALSLPKGRLALGGGAQDAAATI
jgi:hypothetical protein